MSVGAYLASTHSCDMAGGCIGSEMSHLPQFMTTKEEPPGLAAGDISDLGNHVSRQTQTIETSQKGSAPKACILITEERLGLMPLRRQTGLNVPAPVNTIGRRHASIPHSKNGKAVWLPI
jgi:hypothetical protein